MREQRQKEALAAIEEAGFNCTIKACVGFGKTILSQRVLIRMLELGELKEGDKILFQTSTENLIKSFKKEALLCEGWYGVNVLEKFNWEFYCFPSLRLLNNTYDFVISDEVDIVGATSLLPILTYKGRSLQMSGTFSTTQKVEIDGKLEGKLDLLTRDRPLVFSYDLSQAQEEGILTGFKTTLIFHTLEKGYPYAKVFAKQNPVPEFKYFELCSKMVENNRFTKPFMVRRYGLMATKLLESCPSKISPIQDLVKSLSDKRGIVWAKNLDFLELCIPGFVETSNNKVLQKFDNKEINVIGTSKKLKRGITPIHIDYLIIVSPITTITDLEQLLGRVIRIDDREDKLPDIYIFVTEDTYEPRWLSRGCVEIKDSRVVRTIDLNICDVRRTNKGRVVRP